MTRQQSTCRSIFFGLILAHFVVAGCGGAEEEGRAARADGNADAVSAAEAIRMVLNKQVEAWNQGRIRAFMEGYAQTDSLRFATGGDVWYGWNRTLQRYQDSFADKGMMGTLSFDELDITLLSSDHALVFGRWALERSAPHANVGGLFTLVFQNRPEGWRIVHDHTSARSTNAQASDTLTSDFNHGQPVE